MTTYNTAGEALNAAGLNWTVGAEPLRTVSGLFVDGFNGIVRQDNNKVLGVVGDGYVPFQNLDSLSLFDGVIEDFGASYVNAGSFKGGRLVYVQAKLGGEIVIPGKASENIAKFLTLTTSHDGSKALRAGFSATRIVCQNTFMRAHSDLANGVSVRHTTNMMNRISQAREILGLSKQYFDALQDDVVRLADTRYTDAQMANLAAQLFPADRDGKLSKRAENSRDEIKTLFVYGRGHEAIRGTAWAALNAVTEYVDHHRPTRVTEGQPVVEARMESAWFGSGLAMKNEGMAFIQKQLVA